MTKRVSWYRKNFYLITWWLDMAMVPVFLSTFATGVLMFPGFIEMIGLRTRDVPFETVQFIHDWSGLALGTGVLLHLALHWRPALQFLQTKVFRKPTRPEHA